MSTKRIKAVIGKDGNVKLEAEGYVGDACDKSLADLSRQLGAMTDDKKKPDYYETEKVSEQVKTG